MTHFAVEASDSFASDADLHIWICGRTTPLEKSPFGKDVDVYAVQAFLARHLGA